MCFRHFGFKSFDEIDRLTIPQVELMKKALTLRQVDEQNNLHMLAFLTNAAGSVKQAGNKQVPMYQTYKSFFDYEAELYKIEHADEIEAKNNRLRELVEKRGKGGYKNE